MRFPEFAARTLQGEEKALPADLPAERTLVLLPFRQWQQRQVDGWIARAEQAGWVADLAEPTIGAARPSRATIEVPCISRRWGTVRRFIDGGMAASIRTPSILGRTWTAYTDVGRVQRALGLSDSDQTWVGVVQPDGVIRVNVLGDVTDQAWAAVATELH